MDVKKIGKKSIFTLTIAAAMLAGAVGGQLLKTNQTNAQTVTPTVSNNATITPGANSNINNGSPSGTFKSNEDPTHESKESAQWEAQENAGQAPWQHK